MKPTQSEQKTNTSGKLFERQKQGAGQLAERPAVDEQQAQDTGPVAPAEETAATGLPVVAETGGAVQVKSEVEIIEDMFPVADNFRVSGTEGLHLKKVGILKETAQFGIESDDGEIMENPKVIWGIVQAVTWPNALWLPFGNSESRKATDTKFPDCHSLTGDYPEIDIYCSECARCKFNAWGSHQQFIKPTEESNGKACKNMAAIVFVPIGWANSLAEKTPELTREKLIEILSGKIAPLKLILPPTSRNALKKYAGTELIMNRRTNISLAITKMTLKIVDKPYKYSVAEFRYAGEIRTEMEKIVKELDNGIELLRAYKTFTADNATFLSGNMVFDKSDVTGAEGEPF